MKKTNFNNIRLGLFVMAGLVFLVILLYTVGKNKSMFGSSYLLKARFENVNGLVQGNNVRYAGIQIGTVKSIEILNDTVIEVQMMIAKHMLPIIKTNAVSSIGTEGLVGNKVINIEPTTSIATIAQPGDLIQSKKIVETDQMINTLAASNDMILEIATNLKEITERLNEDNNLWQLLSNSNLSNDINTITKNFRNVSYETIEIVEGVNSIVNEVRKGNGSLGSLLVDTMTVYHLNQSITSLGEIKYLAEDLTSNLNHLTKDLNNQLVAGKGTLTAVLSDTSMLNQINASLQNIKEGTDNFNQNMEALKHNIFFRKYFRKLEEKKQEENN